MGTTQMIARVSDNGADVSGATDDDKLIEVWLHGKSKHTQRLYGRFASAFLNWVRKPLRQITVMDVQSFVDQLSGAPSSRSLALWSVKSLLTFGHRVGYLRHNAGTPVQAPKSRVTLSERILPEAAVQRMLALEKHPRNHAMLVLFYGTGIRVSELCSIKVRDIQPRNDAGQVTVFGKGGKTRSILVSVATWQELLTLVDGQPPNSPVFRSRTRGGHLTTSAVWSMVRAAAKRAGIEGNVSPHWLRHAHASHALDRGAPVHLVQATLGHASLAVTSKYTHSRPNDSSSRYLSV